MGVPSLALAAILWAATGGIEVFHLADGREIRAEVVKESGETLFLDLGWTVIGVPRQEIVRRESVAAASGEAEALVETSEALYRTGRGREASVKENVAAVQDAVVLVSTPSGLGSGFLISPDGHVITNDHVVQGETQITVTLFEKTATGIERRPIEDVKIVAMNAYVDLALLKIEGSRGAKPAPKAGDGKEEGKDAAKDGAKDAPAAGASDSTTRDFPYVRLAENGSWRVGESVFAIGNPLGLERSVSQGILSTLNRPFDGLTYLQTTAQINPGNSGGPLFDLRGNVIGVTNMKILFGEGLSFAVPVDRVRWFLENREAFLFDKDNPNTGYRYLTPPRKESSAASARAK